MKGLRCVVLSGEGKAFCAGLDMASFAAMKQDGDAVPGVRDLTKRTHGIANRPQQCAWLWRELPVPVIAAVHGVAFGGGFQIALGADMRYATADTRFSVMEIKWGLVPDLAGTQLMRHLAREDVVRELTYTGRVFNGTEAQQFGFVTRVVDDPRAAALETAREIAGKSPDAMRAAKRLLNVAVATDAASGLMAEVGRAAEADRLAQPARGRSCRTCRSAPPTTRTDAMNRQWLYAKQPQGKIAADTFEWTETAIPVPRDGEALVQTRMLSLDPANRAWMMGKTYRDALEPGQVMSGFAIGEVVESKTRRAARRATSSRAIGAGRTMPRCRHGVLPSARPGAARDC